MASTGEQLGRYHLVRKLAQGGMAEVFLAKVMGPGGFEKSLVIKRILPNLAKDPSFVSMFLAEARLAAQFGHPAVVQIFDFGEVNGAYFLAMEFVDGPNLRNILRASPDRRISPVVGARVIEEACEGLAYVHEFADGTGEPMGLMHCDVSTDNLLIARNGAVKVVDFGVAKGAGEVSNAEPGTVKGKIAYMPPEQIIGEADLRADVYALGVILYELAAGTRPYEHQPDQQLLATIITTDPVPLLSRKPDVPREYANIVAKAMAKNLSQRFQNCRELAAALEEFVANSGQRVGTRQLAALAAQFKEGSEAQPPSSTPVLATPRPQPAPIPVSPPLGVPVAAPPPRKSDPFAAFGTARPRSAPTPAPAPPPAPVPPPSPAAPTRADELFSQFFSDLDAPEPPPSKPPELPKPVQPVEEDDSEFFAHLEADDSGSPALAAKRIEPAAPPKPVEDDDDSGMKVTIGVGRALVSMPSRAPLPSPASSPSAAAPRPGSDDGPERSGGTWTEPQQRGSSGLFTAPPSAPKPSVAPAPPPAAPKALAPARVLNTAESRAALVMADAANMRLFEPGSPLASLDELEAVRREYERDEALFVLVRFPSQAHRLLHSKDNEALVIERVEGAVEALLLAEAWGALATLLERLRAAASVDVHQRKVFDVALWQLATADQARIISQRLREAPPSDLEGLGRLLPFFGAQLAPLWLTLFENLDLPASRDAVLPGLAGLAGLNPAPFLEKLQPKRPRRLMELAYCLEKGRVPDRQRVTRELLTRLDPVRRRDVLTGLARAGSDEAFRIVCKAITEADAAQPQEMEATRVHAIQLLGKHFPERVFEALHPLLTSQGAVTWSEPERRAMWIALGASTVPAAFEAVSAELMLRAPILGRAKADARKVDVLEALAVMKTPQAFELMKRLSSDHALSDTVRAAADRHFRAAELIDRTTPTHTGESRRWDRNPIVWRDVLLDLAALAAGSRLVEVDSATFDVAFARLGKCLATLLPAGTAAIVSCTAGLTVNGKSVSDGADLSAESVVKAFQGRGIAGFTFTRQPARAELEHLVRWLAAGANAEGVETPSITLVLTTQSVSKPASPPVPVPLMSDFSREAMIRYVELVLTFRGWLSQRKLNPRAEPPNVAPLLGDLAAAASSRSVRFAGLTPRARGREAELFHSANVLTLAILFGAELNLQQQQLLDLATYAFFADVGNLDLKDETLERSGPLSESDQQDVATARRLSARFPFTRLGDKPGAVAWASVVLEQEIDWGTREKPGGKGEHSEVGLMGSVVALARAYETLTTGKALSRDEALEVLTTKVAHHFRPELLPLFGRFVQRLTLRPLGS